MSSVIGRFIMVMALASDVLWNLNSFAATDPPDARPAATAAGSGSVPNVIFDTDMWSDIDDAMALAMLHTLQDRRELNLVAVTISTDEKWCAPYVELVNTFYGRPNVPIGSVRHGFNEAVFWQQHPSSTGSLTRYTQVLSEERNAHGELRYPHRLMDGTNAAESVSLLRKTLSAMPDSSVVVIQVGYSTNLARLLDSLPDAASPLNGRELVRKKVRLLSVMAGNFAETLYDGKTWPKGAPEFNLVSDVPAAQKVFSTWPTSVVASGIEIGLALPYPATSIERDFAYVPHHPIAETYRTYAAEQNVLVKWPHDHATFDLTAVLYAIRPDRNYFSLSNPGQITVLPDGGSQFSESSDGLQRYLILSGEQRARVLEALVMLVSQPPVAASHAKNSPAKLK